MYKAVVIMLLTVLCGFRSLPTEDTDSQVMQIADSQMDVYLAKIEPGKEGDFGFTENDDFDLCTIGKPYRLIEFNSDFYDNVLQDNNDYISIKNKWLAPIVLNKQNKALLTVEGSPGNLSVSGIGGAILAHELQQKSAGANDSDAFYLLNVPKVSADFFVHERNNSFSEAQFVPLESALIFIPSLAPGKTYTLTEIEGIVKEALTKPGK